MWHVPRPCSWTLEGRAGDMPLRQRSGSGTLVGKHREIFWGQTSLLESLPSSGEPRCLEAAAVLPVKNLREAQT